MKCPKCDNETFIDHVEVKGDTTQFVYVCMNPKCSEYRKAQTLLGEEKETTIQERGS